MTRMMIGSCLGQSDELHTYDDRWCNYEPKCRDVDPNETEETAVQVPTPYTPRASVLEEARDLITGDRNAQYGPPTQDFARTAALLNALGYRRADAEDEIHDILASDVALIVMQVKMSRLMHGRDKRDTWVDLAGYSGCGFECTTVE